MKKLFLLIPLICLSLGCGKKDEGSNSQKPTEQQTAAGAIVFPSSGLQDLRALPAGRYVAKRVRTYTHLKDRNLSALFDHEFSTLGSPKNGDPVNRTNRWDGVNRADEIIQLTSEIHLPLEIVSSGTDTTFLRRQYYWNYARSNDAWGWQITGDEDPRGQRFHTLVTSNTVLSPSVYGTANLKTTATLSGNQLLVFYQVEDGQKTQVVEITYIKQ